MLKVDQTLSKLVTLLNGDLSFSGENSGYGAHSLHAFAAKFPPQLPRTFIENMTEPTQVVLDPMCGSGTAIVEAQSLGRQGIGFDIDPLAVLETRVKARRFDPDYVTASVARVASKAREFLLGKDIERSMRARFDSETIEFLNYWFLKTTQRELLALINAIEAEDDEIRPFLEVVFSSIIITKSGGVTLARDLAHSRPHLDSSKRPKNSIEVFESKGVRAASAMIGLPEGAAPARVEIADARSLPLSKNSVDLVITSPPYANAIDYQRAHKFSLIWLGFPIRKLQSMRSDYIGTERVQRTKQGLPSKVEDALRKITSKDAKRGMVIRQYFVDMQSALSEIRRVLRGGSPFVMVVGDSTVRGSKVPTSECLQTIALEIGFVSAGMALREIDRNKRMLPFSRNHNGLGIESRMHQEFILGFVSP